MAVEGSVSSGRDGPTPGLPSRPSGLRLARPGTFSLIIAYNGPRQLSTCRGNGSKLGAGPLGIRLKSPLQ